MAELVVSHRGGQVKSLPAAGGAGLPSRQEEWPFPQKRCSAVQAANPFHDGLRVSRLEVRCTKPHSEAAGVSNQVSSDCY